jgi:ribosomal protein S27E
MSNKPKKFKISAEEQRYNKMAADIEAAPLYDGRGKGIDVYRCQQCGEEQYTYYRDKGVTPFLIRCNKCGQIAQHRTTLKDMGVDHRTLKVWVRPTYEQFTRLERGLRDHVLRGGLVLEEDVK